MGQATRQGGTKALGQLTLVKSEPCSYEHPHSDIEELAVLNYQRSVKRRDPRQKVL